MKATPEELRCPFCYHTLEPPKEQLGRKILEYPLGVCEHCSAVYAFDITGHNMGSAFIEALLFACNDDDYFAFSLSYGQDYDDAVIGNYDITTHKVIPEKFYHDRYVRGALVFVRLHDEFRETTEEKIKEKTKILQPMPKTSLRSENFSKEKVQEYVRKNSLEELASLAKEDSRVIKELQKMLYTPDENLRWKIINILGFICKNVAKKKPDIVNKFINNLLQSAAYPGASAWGALETIGSIISNLPDMFGEFTKPLLSFLVQKNFRKQVSWAIGKIAEVEPGLVKYSFRALTSFLDDEDPAVRGYAAWALGNIGFNDVIDKLRNLEDDQTSVSIWHNGSLQETTISGIVKEAISKISRQ